MNKSIRIFRAAGLVAALVTLAGPLRSNAAYPASVRSWIPASGNMSLLVLTDSSAKEERLELDKTLLAALDHFGMPFQLLDLSKEKPTAKALLGHPGIIIAQAGLGKSLSKSDVAAMEEAIKKGVGLVNFDGSLTTYPAEYLQMLGIKSNTTMRVTWLKTGAKPHPIIGNTAAVPDRKFELVQPVEMAEIETPAHADVLLRTEGGRPAAFAKLAGKGKVVQFTLPPKFWLPEYFGHVHGLDGVFWRSIAWSARKPFAMLAMPPFVAARIDDASGSGSSYHINEDGAARSFRFISSLNKFGYKPNVGLFTDDITDEDGKVLKQKFDAGLAEFSAHAWTYSRFIYINRVRVPGGGKRRVEMVEFTPEDLQQRFAKLDGQFAKWGVKPSKTLNCHCFSPGINALPFLKERGETCMMFAGKFGKDYYDPSAFEYDMKPYGDAGFTFGYMPDHPDFFNVEAHPYVVRDGKYTDADIDILQGNTTYSKESATNRLDAAVKKGAEAIRLGLDSLFFGCLFTHEQRIASLTRAEWERVLGGIDRVTSNWDRVFKNYDYISDYAKSRYDTKMVQAGYDGKAKAMQLKFAGKSTMPLKVYVFNGEHLKFEFREIPVIQGEKSVKLEME